MLQVKSGQLDKLGLLYERHKHKLFGFFFKMNADRQLSEDLVQTVFERILKYRESFSDKAHFVAWIHRMAINVNNDFYRKHSKMRTDSGVDLLSNKESNDQNVDTKIGLNEQQRQLRKAMNMLSKDKKELLVLSKYQGLKCSQIGEMKNMSEVAVRVNIHRALKELKTAFFKLENE
ncbi:sigma-70 family RNA polymerase sigma factor [Spongiivirga sp. MCCC 1A20706]|uniref:RNA polymerase sigma factor n=1 Tax=Spongiivirga sp. MCCC 1A20706 TaxID=3160963 RepID=UPI0039778A57